MNWVFLLMVTTGLMYEESVSEIRELYSEVQITIDSGEGLYLSELEINSTGTGYPGVGNYGRSLDFYWELDEKDYPSSKLLLIAENSQYAAAEQYEEFLFNGAGKLVFYFSSGGYEMVEERFYFGREYLIRYLRDDESTDHPDEGTIVRGQYILMESERLFQAFNLTH